MACRFPIPAWQDAGGFIWFRERTGINTVRSLFLPCGRCVMCRLERSRQWAVRCVHEAKLHEDSCFITLTYDDAHLPVDRCLRYSDYQSFMRRLRKSHGSVSNPVRFFMCGEYGSQTARPHYHACLFGVRFTDSLYFKRMGEFKLYTSETLTKLWPHGSHLIGSVTFESAAYVARYCLEKVTGDAAEEHYRILDVDSGELSYRCPEFTHMSLRPGIGAGFYRRFRSDMYPNGEVVVNGRLVKTPRYYDKLFLRDCSPEERDVLEQRRAAQAAVIPGSEMTDERLEVKEAVALARLALFKRDLG